jgi:putative spermidine/putrescine transport system substrate-binding protein
MQERNSIDRRTLLLTAAFGGAFLGSMRRGHAQSSFAGKTVKVGLSGGGSWRDSVDHLIGEKIRAFGGNLELLIDAPQGSIGKLVAARGGPAPFDVLESGPNLIQLAQRLVVDLDYSELPNAKPLPAFARGKDYVSTCASEDCVVYNHDIFQKNGIPVPQHYRELAHPKLKGKVAFPDINHVQHWNAAVGLAYDAGGDEAHLEKAMPLINEIHPSYLYATSTDLATKMASGEVWAAAWHSGWAVRLRRTGVPLSASYMNIGSKKGALWPVINQLVRNAPNPSFGLKFIDLYLDPDVQIAHAKATGVIPINTTALAQLGEDPLNKEILLLKPAEIENLFIVDFSKVDQASWRDRWNKDLNRG